MKCPKCQSENIKVEDSHRECLDCYHIWEKEDDGTRQELDIESEQERKED